MTRKFILPLLGLLLLALSLTQCRKSDAETAYDLRFITEEYEPFNYRNGDRLTGLAPEVLREICDRLGIPFRVEVLPWEDGYAAAHSDERAVLFSTVLNAERHDQFKWAGPFASLDWNFYCSSSYPITLRTIDDAREVAAIGVIADYAIEQYLTGLGFTNLVYCSDNIQAFDKLLKGEIDLFPSDRFTAAAALASLNASIYNVIAALTIRTDMVYFAFNHNISDQVVADFQQEIDRMKDNGLLRSLYQQFLNSSDVPGKLQLFTEQYPPLTYRDNSGEITGFGTDIVREIMMRRQVYDDIRLSSWSNGYELALYNPNFCLFTMDRTDIRDTLFQWVGPIGTNTTWFFTRQGSGIVIASLDDARSLGAVGTVTSWFSDQYLRQLGFTNLVSHSDPLVMTERLMNGEIDAFVCSDVTFPSILQSLGYTYGLVVPSFALMASDYYIAFSLGTPAGMVSGWNDALEQMKQDGTYDAIRGKWFPGKGEEE